jgi:hypothetical protein
VWTAMLSGRSSTALRELFLWLQSTASAVIACLAEKAWEDGLLPGHERVAARHDDPAFARRQTPQSL